MRRLRSEQGSALMLAPAGVLVLLILGAISVDSAIAFTGQRELENQAVAAVNDAATLAIADDSLQQGGAVTFDADLAAQLVRERLTAANYSGVRVDPNDIVVDAQSNTGTITVTVAGDVDYIFAKAVPGARHSAHVAAQASAQLQHRSAD